MDPKNKSPVLLLREKDGSRALPIWIGLFEANAIALKLAGLEPPRPMTHDLLFNTLAQAGLAVVQVAVTELQDNTFYASITLKSDGGPLQLDSRPSDAIALAVRAGCPILVAEEVLESSAVDISSLQSQEQEEKWLEMLEGMDPEQFSKYKM